jgi:hypothetical protein
MVDDTDDATLEKVNKAYAFLDELGIKATKTVWVFPSKRKSGDETTGKWCNGVTIADPDYLNLIKDIKLRGHEIAMHAASGGNNFREETISAYEIFKKEFGSYPTMNVMHGRNIDSLYHGKEAFKGIFRFLTGLYCADTFEGYFPQSPYFWGDIFADHSRYARSYKSTELNTLRVNPSMPYYVPEKPFVPRWFSSTDLSSKETIQRNLTYKAVERLVKEEGTCLGYTYFQYYFDDSLNMNPMIEERFRLLSRVKDDGWFTPASPLLDRLELIHNLHIQNNRGRIMVFNHNNKPVNDVWIRGPGGSRVYCENGEQIVIGSSGTGHFDEISVRGDNNRKAPVPQLRPGEEFRMILLQTHLLMLRHFYGRPLRRKGF